MSTQGEEAYGLKIQPDGKIVAVGSAPDNGATPLRFAVARYNTDGALDTSFDSDGKVTTPVTGDRRQPALGGAEPHGVAIDSSGRVIVSGWSREPEQRPAELHPDALQLERHPRFDLRDGRNPVHGLPARGQGQFRRPRCCRPDRRG